MTRALLLGGVALAASLAAPAQADVVVGPRVSYYFDNSNLRTSSLDDTSDTVTVDEQATALLRQAFGEEVVLTERQQGSGVQAEQVGFAMIGGMVNFGDDRDRITITAMYGEGSGALSQTESLSRELRIGPDTITDIATFTGGGDVDTRRYDFEATWQRRTSENFAIFGGVRYERLETSGDVDLRTAATNNIGNILQEAAAIVAGDNPPPPAPQPPPAIGLAFQQATLETYSIRAGVTAFVPVGESANVFFNGMLHASYQPDYSSKTDFLDPNSRALVRSERETLSGETSFGPDIAVGVQFVLSEDLALDLRYRAILFFPVSGEQDFADARVNHGVNVGLSLRL